MATPGTLLERAKQGEPAAIAALMNRTLAKQNSKVRVLRQANQYKLLVESAQVPPQVATVKWISQGLRKLAIPNLETAIIYGKARDSSQPAWQQRVALATPQTDTAADETQTSTHTGPQQASNEPNPTETSTAEASTTAQSSTAKTSEPALDLSEYCFTRNKSLLKGNLTLPSKAVIQLVLSFHSLSNIQKQAVLPHVDKALRNKPISTDATLGAEATAWLAQISELEGPDLRKGSIWLSRYCLEAATTVDQLDVTTPEPQPEETPDDPNEINQSEDEPAQQEPFPTTHHHKKRKSSRAQYSATANNSDQSETSTAFANTNGLPLWVIPTVWVACLLVFIALGINSVKAADYGYPICADTMGSPVSCMLAVQLTGDEMVMTDVIESASPVMTPALKESAIDQCSEAGYWITSKPPMGTSIRPDREEVITINTSSTDEIFPGVLLTNITQTDSHAEGASIRMACLDYAENFDMLDFATDDFAQDLKSAASGGGQVEMTANLVNVEVDEIPENWPTEAYDGFAEVTQSFEKFDGAYNVFVSFGANTLFTSVGLVVAVIFCSCYRCHTLNGIYKTSLVLGILETLIFMIPRIGFFSGIAMEVMAIGTASLMVKEFTVDWTYGYNSLMLGAVTMLAIRFILNMMMYGAIAYFIFA